MKIIKANAILNWKLMKQYQQLHWSEYLEWKHNQKEILNQTLICVSHRWITTTHPDPQGAQLRELQHRLKSLFARDGNIDNCLVFYDYSSMSQKPRNPNEELFFREDLSVLNTVFASAHKVIILSEGYTDYKNRAWCFLEAIISHENRHLFDDQKFIKSEMTLLREAAFRGVADISISSWSLSYKLLADEAESLIVIFQHLDSCRVTDPNDLPLIKSQMTAYLNNRRPDPPTPYGKMLIALNKYFDVVLCGVSEDGVIFLDFKPFFEEPTWARLPPPNPYKGFLGGGSDEPSVFALPRANLELIKAKYSGKIVQALRLSRDGVEDFPAFLRRFQQDKNWQNYVVEAGAIFNSVSDPFPTLDHVIHTLLEKFPPLVGFKGSHPRYMYFSLIENRYDEGSILHFTKE